MIKAVSQFKTDALRLTRNLTHRAFINTALKKYEVARDARKGRYQNWQSARQAAAEIKWETINHLDKYLTEFVSKTGSRGTEVHWASTVEQAREIIIGIIREKQAHSIVKSKVMTNGACAALSLETLLTDQPYEATRLEACEVGISECDALIAQTGSVLITSKSAGGRALTVLPPHHVVIARREQLVPDLPAAFAVLRGVTGRTTRA